MSENNPFIEYNLLQNTYASFDASTLKQHIIERLNQSNIFVDQTYEGSNLNTVIDIIAYSYHILLFYLNQTSSETTFNQATLYENMNKIVSVLGYKPTGRQTSLAVFNLAASGDLPKSVYILKRFGRINVGGFSYCLLDDVLFEKTTNEVEDLSTSNNFLYQGNLVEYPIQTAIGEEFEVIFIAYDNFIDSTTKKFIADNTFRVFIKEIADNKWYKWEETTTLFDSNGTARVFEKRLNEYGRFEFKFGDNINGRKLTTGDQIAIYFVYSDGSSGVISSNKLRGIPMLPLVSNQFNEISDQLYAGSTSVITDSQLPFLTFDNANQSLPITNEESVDQIRKNVPLYVKSQNRAVTVNDYIFYINKNLNGIIASCNVINNTEFVNDYLKYFYNIGLKTPNNDVNLLLNQVNYMTSANFGNVYAFCVPKIGGVNEDNKPIFLSQSQKELVINEVNPIKMATHTMVPMDPIYQAFDLGVATITELPYVDISNNSYLVLIREKNSKQSKEKIKTDVNNIVVNYFSIENTTLGQVVSLSELFTSIINLPGVKDIFTTRIDVTGTVLQTVKGLSFLYYNPIYTSEDVNITTQDVPLFKFQYPYLNNYKNFINKIIVQDE